MVLGILTFGLMAYVIILGVQSRQDVKTEKRAQEIAEKLNSYISKNQEIPESLSAADIKDVPDTIKFSKTSDEKYKFCVTYKAAKGYGGGDITSVLYGAAASQTYGSSYDSYQSDYEPSTLYIGYTHKKGEDCQTIKPYIYNYDSYNSYDDPYCDPSSQYYDTYKDYCLQVGPNSAKPKTTVQ